MADSRLGREVVVGSIVLVALAIFVVGTFFLSGKSLFRPEGERWRPGRATALPACGT